MRHAIRPTAIAGTWYPGSSTVLRSALEACLSRVTPPVSSADRVLALIAPHAGLKYSGPVAAYAYRQLQDRRIELAVLVGPSHFVAFDGVSVYARGGFETPLGIAGVDESCTSELLAATPVIHEWPEVHGREHSLEMQLLFLQYVAPHARIVPLLMGVQTAPTAAALSDALVSVLADRIASGRVVLIASTDLSHYHDAGTASQLDAAVIDQVSKFDPDGLQQVLDRRPEHACGGGPMVSILRAARALGATRAEILRYADSGDVSGDKSSVVGYLAAACVAKRADG